MTYGREAHEQENDTIERVFEESEYRANQFSLTLTIIISLLLLVYYILIFVGAFEERVSYTTRAIIVSDSALLLASGMFALWYGCDRKSLKYVLMYAMIFAAMFLVMNLGGLQDISLAFVIPMLLSCRYYNKRFSVQIAVSAIVLNILALVLCGLFGELDLNNVRLERYSILVVETDLWSAVKTLNPDRMEILKALLRNSAVVSGLLMPMVGILTVGIAANSHELVFEQHESAIRNSRINAELEVAKYIQADMLPARPISDASGYDISARTIPANELGGDFYDFYMTDKNHVAVAIGDVSGKGVPAALYMVKTKTLLKNYATMGLELAEILKRTNEELIQGNTQNQFVTVWMGILDLRTGEMDCTNAGHNPPVRILQNRTTVFLRLKPGFVLGGIEGVEYQHEKVQLKSGERMVLYTDGVTEATDRHFELFGEERLERFLRERKGNTPAQLISDIKAEIETFTMGAKQSDDITVLVLDYK